jgi:L-seryl-tRNA(Ser) seleniumtransferase
LEAASGLSKKSKHMPHSVDGSPIVPITSGLGSTDIYQALGVTPLININGTVTVIGGSVMKPEVMELIRQGNEHFVLIDELEVAAGKFIAKLCKSPVGYTGLVTGGAAAAMVVGYAGMMSEDWENRIRELPDTTNCPRNEVIIQKSHRYAFDHQIRQTGAKLVEVVTREEMIAAINPKTVAIHFTNILSANGKVSGPETVEIARAHNVYTFNDASADVPPVSRLWEYPAVGFDMVTFSGGKDICGPQASGILIGKEELIHWSLLNMSPQEDRIGRCCKVGKETIFGLLKALEIFVNQDYDATLRMYDARAQLISDAIAKFGVTALPREFNPEALGNVTPVTAGISIPQSSRSLARRSCRSWPTLGRLASAAWVPEQAECGAACPTSPQGVLRLRDPMPVARSEEDVVVGEPDVRNETQPASASLYGS